MTVVIGTAGHIDHGKTTLLRALTGIDADRLPEERRRGMTIDVGYAHLTLHDGTELDFVDVPGHDRLIGNMLVGAGEIDAAMLVVAADDGPRAQTVEHLALLDALAVRHGVAVVTKTDLAGPERAAEVVAAVGRLLEGTSLGSAAVLAVSSVDGEGLEGLRSALMALRDDVLGSAGADRAMGAVGSSVDPPADAVVAGSRLAIDRVFAVKGRGAVVTGTLRGRPLTRGATLRLVPGDRPVRVREIQVHGATVDVADGGRTAVNLAGVESGDLHRGLVLSDDPAVGAGDRLLIRLGAPLPDRARARVHVGTAATDASVGRSGRDALELPDGSAAAILRLSTAVAVAVGDRMVLRRTSGTDRVVGAVVLDIAPPHGISRRRQTSERVGRLADAVEAGNRAAISAARLDLHGVSVAAGGPVAIAPDVLDGVEAAAVAAVGDGSTLTAVRSAAARSLRRQVTIGRAAAASAAGVVVDGLVRTGRLVRVDAAIRLPGSSGARVDPDPEMAAAMDRLERALGVPAPAGLAETARRTGCPPDGIRALERTSRIVVLEPDLAYSMTTYRDLTARALTMAARSPLTPAALRDATGTSRKYVMAILTDLDRRGVLRRTPDGHVPGPRGPG